jgi:hypothetical protein
MRRRLKCSASCLLNGVIFAFDSHITAWTNPHQSRAATAWTSASVARVRAASGRLWSVATIELAVRA